MRLSLAGGVIGVMLGAAATAIYAAAMARPSSSRPRPGPVAWPQPCSSAPSPGCYPPVADGGAVEHLTAQAVRTRAAWTAGFSDEHVEPETERETVAPRAWHGCAAGSRAAGTPCPDGSMHQLSAVTNCPEIAFLTDHPATSPCVWSVLGWNIHIYHSHLDVNPPSRGHTPCRFDWHLVTGMIATLRLSLTSSRNHRVPAGAHERLGPELASVAVIEAVVVACPGPSS